MRQHGVAQAASRSNACKPGLHKLQGVHEAAVLGRQQGPHAARQQMMTHRVI